MAERQKPPVREQGKQVCAVCSQDWQIKDLRVQFCAKNEASEVWKVELHNRTASSKLSGGMQRLEWVAAVQVSSKPRDLRADLRRSLSIATAVSWTNQNPVSTLELFDLDR